MATPPDTNMSSRPAWKGKGPATIADEELHKYPLDRLQAEVDRRKTLQLSTPDQVPNPEGLPDAILGLKDIGLAYTLQRQLDDMKEDQMQPQVFWPLHVPGLNPLASLPGPLQGLRDSRVRESDTRPKLVGPHEPGQAHTTPPNTTSTAVVDSNDETHDTTTPSNTTATAVVESNNETHDTTTPSNTTSTAVVNSNNETHDTTTPSNTTSTAVVDSNNETHDTTTPSNTTSTAVVDSNNETHDTKTPSNSTSTAVVDSNNEAYDMKHTTPPNTTSTAVVESGVTLSEDEVDALVTADLEAEMNRFRYTKEAKQWIDIKEEPECSSEVERDSRLRQYFNVVVPGPNADKVAPAEFSLDTEWFRDVPSDLKHAFKEKIKGHLSYDKIKGNLSYVQAHCIMQLTGKAGQELQKLTGSSFKGDQDALVISNTGSGKTEALLLTLLTAILENTHLLNERSAPSTCQFITPIALVVVPTRTLAQQIFQTLIDMIRFTNLRGVGIYGGTGLDLDYAQLRRGCDIMIATPGRLIHLLEAGIILSLWNTRWVVIDEANAMLAPNFEEQLDTIQSYLPQRHNLWLFTSVLRESRLTEALRMLDEFHVRIDEETLANKDKVTLNEKTVTKPRIHGVPMKDTSKDISVRQDIIPVKCDEDKLEYLFKYFRDTTIKATKVLILARNPVAIELLHMSLGRDLRLNCSALSKEYTEREREIALTEFIRGINIVLVTSFQLSNGLNLADLETVFVHDMPYEFDDYVAGVGRVGRMGNTGIARVFFNVEKDIAMAIPLSDYLEAYEQEVPGWLKEIVEKEDPWHYVAEDPEDAAAANQSAPTHDNAADWTQETAT